MAAIFIRPFFVSMQHSEVKILTEVVFSAFQSLTAPHQQPLPDVGYLLSATPDETPLSYGRHSSKNPSEKFVACNLCGKHFYGPNRKSHLTRHLVTHSGVKPHACPHCPHRTNRSENLKLHMRLKHPEMFTYSLK